MTKEQPPLRRAKVETLGRRKEIFLSLLQKALKWGGLILLLTAALVAASQVPNMNPDALAGLTGVLLGALITVGLQFWGATLERRHQLRLAAAEKRLQAHQEAFALWRKLVQTVHHEKQLPGVIAECQTWWDNNCLYLSPEARKKFRFAYICAASHRDFVKDRSKPQLVRDNWDNITDAGPAIVAGAELPTLGQEEAEFVVEGKP